MNCVEKTHRPEVAVDSRQMALNVSMELRVNIRNSDDKWFVLILDM